MYTHKCNALYTCFTTHMHINICAYRHIIKISFQIDDLMSTGSAFQSLGALTDKA